MAKRIGIVSGTALLPGVSANGRLYTAEVIGKAVRRAQERLGGDGLAVAYQASPITQRSHHAADDDSTRIVGRVTRIWQDDSGAAKFTADIADTDHGRTILNLARTDDGQPPFLRNVSIRGAWVGKVRREKGPDGRPVETADDLTLDGLDYTARPGVAGAVIDHAGPVDERAEPTESNDRSLIYESIQEALVESTVSDETTEDTAVVVEVNSPKPVTPVPGGGPYADPGYQADKKKRHPLDSKAHAKSAWSFINQADNAKLYSANQLKRIKGRIKSALKKFGVQVAAENWLIDTADAVTEAGPVAEGMSGEGNGTFCLNATNGPLSITLSSYCVDPADMEVILHSIVDSAVMALKNVDPDMDGDMDVPGADSEDTDDDMESAAEAEPAERMVEADEPTPEPSAEPAEETEDPAPDPAAVPQNEEEEPAVSEPTTPAVEPTPAATDKPAESSAMDALNAKFDKLTDAISGLVSKMAPAPAVAAESAAPATQATQETAPAESAAEAPKEVAETQEQMIARLVAEGVKAERTRLVQELAESGQGPARKGLVAPVNEHTAPVATGEYPEGWPTENGSPKPLHKWSDAERREHMFPALEQYVLGSRAR